MTNNFRSCGLPLGLVGLSGLCGVASLQFRTPPGDLALLPARGGRRRLQGLPLRMEVQL